LNLAVAAIGGGGITETDTMPHIPFFPELLFVE
jgi:hypothetical protein